MIADKDNKKFYQILGVICIIEFMVCIIVSQFSYISDLKKEIVSLQSELNEYRYEEVELNNCPVCGKEVKLKPINDRFYIECERWNGNDGCGLTTGYYDSKAKLIKEWNDED